MQVNGFDRNGLELSPMAETLNAYKGTAMDRTAKRVVAYARSSHSGNQMSMFNIALFKDPREAAYVAQEFARKYSKDDVKTMVTDGTFRETCNDFVANVEIPEWKYPAEGLTFDDLECNYGYTRNRVENAKDALVEAFKVFGKKIPSLKEVPSYIKAVQDKYSNGLSFREAARQVVSQF